MSAVAYLPNSASVDAAWERYQVLVQASLADPRLNADRSHIEATIRAHEAFRKAYLAWGAK